MITNDEMRFQLLHLRQIWRRFKAAAINLFFTFCSFSKFWSYNIADNMQLQDIQNIILRCTIFSICSAILKLHSVPFTPSTCCQS